MTFLIKEIRFYRDTTSEYCSAGANFFLNGEWICSDVDPPEDTLSALVSSPAVAVDL